MANAPMSEREFAALSDDEIMNMSFAPEMEQTSVQEEEVAGEDPEDQEYEPVVEEGTGAEADPEDPDDEEVDPEADATGSPEGVVEDEPDLDDDAFAAQDKPAAPKKVVAAKEPEKAPAKPDAEAKPEADTPAAVAPIDYKAAYEQIMLPFKANGKEVKLESPDDVIRLMQMGANYTKKLQALTPNLKVLKMLEKNGLLDETKLSYLIDIDKKNPAAIQKAIKDSGIDPMDIDTTVDPGYKPGNYKVSDEEMRFTGTLEDITSEPSGKELVGNIHKTWDKKSKDALWTDPSILTVLAEQNKNGIYAQISAEVDRQKTLGHHRNTPFLETYHKVGSEMQNKGLLVPKTQGKAAAVGQGITPAPSQTEPRRVVDQRTGLRKTANTVINTEKAKAASSVKTTASKKVVADLNPLSMSDEEFAKSADLARML